MFSLIKASWLDEKGREGDSLSQSAVELSAQFSNEVNKVVLIGTGAQEMTALANHAAPTC